MKLNLFLLFFILLLSSASFAGEIDELSDTVHSRMEMREPHLFKGAIFEEVVTLPDQVQEVRQEALNALLTFATDLDLFDLGFSYELDGRSYSITNQEGTIVAYTVSVWISKNDEPMTRRFYILHRRVDGIYYVGRIANYDLF